MLFHFNFQTLAIYVESHQHLNIDFEDRKAALIAKIDLTLTA